MPERAFRDAQVHDMGTGMGCAQNQNDAAFARSYHHHWHPDSSVTITTTTTTTTTTTGVIIGHLTCYPPYDGCQSHAALRQGQVTATVPMRITHAVGPWNCQLSKNRITAGQAVAGGTMIEPAANREKSYSDDIIL